jgi:hypothetical protein
VIELYYESGNIANGNLSNVECPGNEGLESSAMGKPPVKVKVEPELLDLVGEGHQAWRNSLSAEELARYGGKYIATRKQRVVAASKSLDDLYQQLEAQGLRGRCLIEFIEEPDVVVIYG